MMSRESKIRLVNIYVLTKMSRRTNHHPNPRKLMLSPKLTAANMIKITKDLHIKIQEIIHYMKKKKNTDDFTNNKMTKRSNISKLITSLIEEESRGESHFWPSNTRPKPNWKGFCDQLEERLLHMPPPTHNVHTWERTLHKKICTTANRNISAGCINSYFSTETAR